MIPKIPAAAAHVANQAAQSPKVQSFGKVMQQAKPAGEVAKTQPPQANPQVAKPRAAELLSEVSSAQAKLDQILKMAESGRTFSPAELLAFQAHAYRASQELDLASKVVEKATDGAKQTLNTQV